jgi:hypothetical protein
MVAACRKSRENRAPDFDKLFLLFVGLNSTRAAGEGLIP